MMNSDPNNPIQNCQETCPVGNRLKAQETLVHRLDSIIESSFDGLWICDPYGKVLRINKASERINGVTQEQVVGKEMKDLIAAGLIDRSVTLEVLEKRTTVTVIQNLRNKKQILVTGNPVFNREGEIELVVVNEWDITNLNDLWNALQESRALASKYRDELSLRHSQDALLEEAVIRSEVMVRVFKTALKVAQVDTTILLQGESGVGKGFMAKLIHRASHRKDGPFIRVDCGAIPESLIESELFGYEKGAFTGARPEGKPGHFELARGGTLFLDEIGDLPANIQIKLLRFLEENEVVRIGGATPHKIDTRVVAATHQDLGQMMEQGSFRKDLFFRVNVIPISIPPLRERREDISAFISFFLNRYAAKYETDVKILPKTLDCLCRYSYPGNIRELSNLVERLVVLSHNQKIDVEDLPTHVRLSTDLDSLFFLPDDLDLNRAIENLERRMIVHALKECGSQRKAAKILGIHQSSLARKVKRFGLNNDSIMHHDVKTHQKSISS